MPNLSCTLPKNSDNSLQIEAGPQKPKLHIKGIGFVIYNQNLSDYNVSLTYSSLNTTNGGSTQGGHLIKILGNGFPLTINSVDQITIILGNSRCPILETSNNFITIRTPVKNLTTSPPLRLVLSMNGITVDAASYAYDDSLTPTIVSLNPPTSSPSQKAAIKIDGSNFGNSTSSISVSLVNCSNSSIFYQLSIVNVTDTEISAILGGGKIGCYYLRIEKQGVGYSKESTVNSSLFQYDLSITGISPTIGSIWGGTTITITGNNFSPILSQNLVFIGDAIDNICDMISSTSNQIICKTRTAPSEMIASPQILYVYQRVLDQAVCKIPTGCNFTFDNTTTASPSINNTGPVSVRASTVVELVGQGLLPQNNSGNVTIYLNNCTSQNQSFPDYSQINAIYSNDTYLNFSMSNLREGTFAISVYIEKKGYAYVDSSLMIVNVLYVDGIWLKDPILNSTHNGSKGGMMMVISGSGFSNESVFVETLNIFAVVYARTATNITFYTGRTSIEGTFKISLYRNSSYKLTCDQCFFITSTTKTNAVTSHNATGNVQSSFVLLLTGTNLANVTSQVTSSLDVYDSLNQNIMESYQGTVFSVNSTNILIRFGNVPTGKYILTVQYQENGFAFIPDSYRYIIITTSNLSIQNINTSYFGGYNLSISGSGLPSSWSTSLNNISICGQLCPVISNSSEYVNCIVPQLLTSAVISQYNLSDTVNSQQLDFKITGDTSSSISLLNDQKINTYYDSGNVVCNATFDFGPDFNINLTKIQYYPSILKSIKLYYGIKFQASADNIHFLDLFALDENIKSGWNSWNANTSLPLFRYLRFIGSNVSRCNLAELKFFGIKTYVRTSSLTNTTCNTLLQLNGNNLWLNSSVFYRQDASPVVSSLNPAIGPSSGGTSVKIGGTGFGNVANFTKMFFDGFACEITSINDTLIICTTGAKFIYLLF